MNGRTVPGRFAGTATPHPLPDEASRLSRLSGWGLPVGDPLPVVVRRPDSAVARRQDARTAEKDEGQSFQTSSAISRTRRTFAHSSSSVMRLPSSVEEKPH